MNYWCEISCRFSGFYNFLGEDIDPDSADERPTTKALQEMQEQFELSVNELIDKDERWGEIKWIQVSLADDYEDYEDSTMIEHFFRVQYEPAEDDIDLTLVNLTIELQEHFQEYRPQDLTVYDL